MRKPIIGLIVVLSASVLTLGLVLPASTRDASRQLTVTKSDLGLSRAGRPALTPFVDPDEIPRTAGTSRSVIRSRGARSPHIVQEYILAEYDFEDGAGGPDPQGWISVDMTAQKDTFFHVDDFSGLADYYPLAGSQSMWCGLRPDTALCQYATLPGYGNNWIQDFESVAFSSTGDVTLTFLISYDCEPNYDFVYLQYLSKSGIWQTLLQFDGTGSNSTGAVVPADSLEGNVKFRFRFVSDAAYSDQDGQYDSNGAVIIDNISIADTLSVLDTQDFESESSGAHITADGDWTAKPGEPFGDYAALFDGSTVVQEDTVVTNNTYLWGFFNGSTDNYSCGGFPLQPVVPFTQNLGSRSHIDYVSNEIRSPWIDLSHDKDGQPVPETPRVFLEFDVYRDLPIENVVFYRFFVRSLVNGCPTLWRTDYLAYCSNQPAWFRFAKDIIDLIEPGATDIQVALRAEDWCWMYCGGTWDGQCHSHAPLFDNVAIVKSEGPIEYVVTNTNDSGPGSLRQAINDTNADPELNVITFDIPGTGPHTIQPLTALPAVASPVIIDAYTQPGASENTNGDGLGGNAVLMIVLDGTLLGGGSFGLHINADYCTIRGLAINNFPSNGIRLDSNENVVEGNYVGTDVTGASPQPNSVGIYVAGNNNRIGGADPAARNVVSGNGNAGIVIFNSNYNRIEGNFIGVTTSGTLGLPNQTDGVFLSGSDYNHIINNLISANLSSGVSAPTGTSIIGNWIRSNTIGTDVTGTAALGNGAHGVYLVDGLGAGPENRVGGAPPLGNVIAYNGGDGVNLSLPAAGVPAIVSHNTIHINDNGVVVMTGNAIVSQNQIHSNAGLGIDLADDGVTANDAMDPDTGPNGLQNYPVLTSVIPGYMAVTGTLNSTSNTEFNIEFFSSKNCDPSAYGEGGTYRGETAVTTDFFGNASFSAALSANIPGGHFITATARPASGSGTSEFCKCLQFFNTPTGFFVGVAPVDEATGDTPVDMTFFSVSQMGNTMLEITDSGPPVPGTFIVGDPPTFYNLNTTATYSGLIQVCFSYDEASIAGAEEDLTILHYDTTLVPPDWVEITTTVNTLLNEVCGEMATLSPFILAVPNPASGVDPRPEVPSAYALYQNVPNPFNPTTAIHYDVPDAGMRITLKVFDVSGRLIKTLVDEIQSAGSKSISWDGTDRHGHRVATGVFFYRMVAGKFVQTRKMVLIK